MAWTERYVRADAAGGGNGTTNTNSGANGAWTLAEAIAAAAAGQRLNVRAGTYANAATDRTFATAGTTTAPVWWRGFSAAIGDLDNDPVTAKPLLTFTSGRFLVTGAHQLFSNLDISGAGGASSAQVNHSAGTGVRFDRCKIQTTGASPSPAFRSDVSGLVLSRCWLKGAASTQGVIRANGVEQVYFGNVIEGGGSGIEILERSIKFLGNVIDRAAAHGIWLDSLAAAPIIVGNTINSPGTDGIRFDVLPSTHGLIAQNLIGGCGGWGINNTTGANTNLVYRVGNDFWSNTSGNETGFGDSPSLSEILESADPWVARNGGDLSLAAAALARAAGGWQFTNRNEIDYRDLGAIQARSGGFPVVGSSMVRGLS